ncbi:MAG: hypothetical protein M3R69_04980 [Acidobacteriota bacterium]|nr:hypothetical protein [Acidobacteriota bacterium]
MTDVEQPSLECERLVIRKAIEENSSVILRLGNDIRRQARQDQRSEQFLLSSVDCKLTEEWFGDGPSLDKKR